MDPTAVARLYDDDYAEAYDQRFLLDAWPKHGADVELAVVEANIPDGGRWLDVGCGTGWFLSQLPAVERAGLDLSPAMVARARAANPDALFIEERSFLDDNPEWHGQWDLVTCIWQPYNYVDDVAQVEQLVHNMAAWTRPGGAMFIPVVDLEDIRPHVDLPYREEPDVWGGSIALTSITWTWNEPVTGKVHTHLVAPQAGHFVELFTPAFRKVEVLRYPPFERGGVARKAILGTDRRGPDDDGADAEVVWHPRPAHPEDLAAKLAVADAQMRHYMAGLETGVEPTGVAPAEEPEPPISAALAAELEENERRWAENNQRWAENAVAWEEAQAHSRAESERANAAEAEASRLRDQLPQGAGAPTLSRAQLAAVPTTRLVRATASRLRPDRLARRLASRR